MIVIASSGDVPVTMGEKQFPFKKINKEAFVPTIVHRLSKEDQQVWAGQFGDWQYLTGQNKLITKNEMSLMIERHSSTSLATEITENIPFRMVADSGMRGEDFFKLAQGDVSPCFVWFLQLAARSVESYRAGVGLSDTPLIHPKLGINYKCPEHGYHVTPRFIRDYLPIYDSKDNWLYVAVGIYDVDLITLP